MMSSRPPCAARVIWRATLGLLLCTLGMIVSGSAHAEPGLSLQRDGHWLVIRGPGIPADGIRINYLEAYCRAGSTDADWVKHTMIKHRSEVLQAEEKIVRLQDVLEDGVTVDHTIKAGADEVTFELVARNPGDRRSEVHWAQPCARLSAFTGHDEKTAGSATDYLPKCFIFVEGTLTRLPFEPWATQARYVPGQVWRPRHVPAADVNPRPVSAVTPSNGLIGCYSADEKLIFATAWEPYQELFQGVARCLHSDFRIGGLAAGEEKRIRGKVYVVANDPGALLTRYERDFPEHRALQKP